MRDPKRIKKVLTALECLWNQYPDMRFFQLVESLYGKDDLFYLEDEKAVDLIYTKMSQWAQNK